MYRDKINDLIKWKISRFRKPLIIRGARQVGKTWLIKEFGKNEYANTVYVNFEGTKSLANLFTGCYDIQKIVTSLQIYSKITITPNDTLIVFDEIQSVEGGLTSLKYFYENNPEYHIIAAGSLLGLGLHSNISFPVGKVDFLDLRPLSFSEFLIALNEKDLAEEIHKQNWEIISVFKEKLIDYLKYYLYVGGMPEVVDVFIQTRDWGEVRTIQNRLLHSYEGDFSKHAPNEIVPRIRMVWESIPAQLAKENKKFIYGVIREGARAKDFELAIQWLVDCGLLLKSNKVTNPGMPLVAYQEASIFKLFLLDVGLLGAMSDLNITTLINGDDIFIEFKGALMEQFVMQQLKTDNVRYIGYWTNSNSTSEVDFIVQQAGIIIPIEVKAGENTKAKSFKLFCEKYKSTKALRISLLDYKKETWMENIPLYAIE